jgi:hypothetical protein
MWLRKLLIAPATNGGSALLQRRYGELRCSDGQEHGRARWRRASRRRGRSRCEPAGSGRHGRHGRHGRNAGRRWRWLADLCRTGQRGLTRQVVGAVIMGRNHPGAKHGADLGRGSRPRFTGNRGARTPAGRHAAGRRPGPRRGPRRSSIRVSPHRDGSTALRRITRPVVEPAEKLIALVSLAASGSSIRCSTFRARSGIRRRRWRCERGRSGWQFRCRSSPSSSPCRRPDRFSAARSRG